MSRQSPSSNSSENASCLLIRLFLERKFSIENVGFEFGPVASLTFESVLRSLVIITGLFPPALNLLLPAAPGSSVKTSVCPPDSNFIILSLALFFLLSTNFT
mmetsp:Transcript_19787/g.36723  ORF Transcript_19787/g.36723 Transcript_19787/m.36723 type:complete len:102 (-) Transcript_19787:396-701(-)